MNILAKEFFTCPALLINKHLLPAPFLRVLCLGVLERTAVLGVGQLRPLNGRKTQNRREDLQGGYFLDNQLFDLIQAIAGQTSYTGVR